MDGILLVDKEGGETSYETSYDVVKKVKKALRGSNVKKVGHAGTLDPLATGLLIILVGQGTKLSSYIMSEKKKYSATVTLGIETDTLDSDGKIVQERDVPILSREALLNVFTAFTGEIEQTPPAFSAVKVDGVRAYKLARKGEAVALKKRRVNIYSLKLTGMDLPELTMEVECSGGTYIRSLAADLGRTAGPGGHLKALRRMAIGPFLARDGMSSSDIVSWDKRMKDRIIPLNEAIPDMREVRVAPRVASHIRCGRQPTWEDLGVDAATRSMTTGRLKMVESGQLVAIARIERDEEVGHGEVKLERVFG
ncbi:MAG: tRNA pseudouridine(55) synthase TruB [Deltaproteobacteria bacterium]|nr:tRNA pseudouridine(55) synthase TruB [Deltaproteobacteria bacterium]